MILYGEQLRDVLTAAPMPRPTAHVRLFDRLDRLILRSRRDLRESLEQYAARRDLRESLEQYAARVGVDAHSVRAHWRHESLRLLHVHAPDVDVHTGLCAIAPGVRIATRTVDWPDDFGGAS